MTTPDVRSTAGASVNDAGTAGSKPAVPPSPSNQPATPTKTKNQNIHGSPAVLDAARRDGEELLRDLRTSLGGLTQAEAEERARTAGPNAVAQARKQGWPVRVLKIIRNPSVILLTTLSAVSYLTGDARAGTVMAVRQTNSTGSGLYKCGQSPALAQVGFSQLARQPSRNHLVGLATERGI
jgi:Mg2+-importing ATPase